MARIKILVLLLVFHAAAIAQQHVYVEAESFASKGGWVVDQQSFVVIGSSF